MNCRFCGTIVSAPPSDCPKCGRPVSAVDINRSADQAATATVLYRTEQSGTQARNPKAFTFKVVVIAVAVTVGLLGYAQYSKSKRRQEAGPVVTQAVPVQQQLEKSPADSVQSEPQSQQGKSTPAAIPMTTETAEEPVSTGPNVEEILGKAQAAFSRGDWIEPPNDNALKWAREARRYGSKDAERLEENIFANMMQSVDSARRAREYSRALEQINQMIHLFPNHTSLPSLRVTIQREQRGGGN